MPSQNLVYQYVDAIGGAIDVGNSLNNSDFSSTLTSAALAGLGAVYWPTRIRISLIAVNQTTQQVTAREDCEIMTHANAAGTATILRAQNGTTKQAWSAASLWVAGWEAEDTTLFSAAVALALGVQKYLASQSLK